MSDVRRALPCLAILALGLLPSPARAAEVEFYAVVDRDEIALDDTVTLTVTINAGTSEEEELRLPESPDFDVVSRSQSHSMQFGMGSGGRPPVFRKVRVITLILQPRKTGTLTIRPGRMQVGGKTYETGAIKVKVLSPDKMPKKTPPPPPAQSPGNPFGLPPGAFGGDEDQEDPFAGILGGRGGGEATDTDLYVRSILDKKQVYLGEQLTLSIYLFSKVDISGVDGFKMPKLDAFWAEDVESPTQITGELKMVDGVPYRVFLLKKRALFPIKAGKTTVEPTEVDVSTGFAMVLPGRKVHRASQVQTVEVLPLPQGAPPGFESTNVGQWHLSAEAAPTVTSLGQTVTLKVTLEGTGNLKNVAMPKLPAITGFKAFDPTTSEKVATVKNRYGGKRVMEYLLMPEQTGTFVVPALNFPYFDPGTKRYDVASTPPLTLRVEAGAGGAAVTGVPSGSSPSQVPDRTQVNVIAGGGLRPLRYKGEVGRATPPLFQRPFFAPLLASPLVLWMLLAGLSLVRSTVTRDDPSARGRGAGSRAKKRLRKSEELLAARNAEGFYAEVSRALNDYLGDRLGRPVVGLTRAELLSTLAARGIPEATVQRICRVLDTCDAGRFAPGATESSTMTGLHDEALAAMNEVEAVKLRPVSQGGAA